MAGIAAVVAAVDPVVRPGSPSLRDGARARSMFPQVNLVCRERHMAAAEGCVMHFVVPIRLGITVDDEAGHSVSPELRQYNVRSRGADKPPRLVVD